MVALMLTDEIPNPISRRYRLPAMGKFRCIDAESAYKEEAIHWPSIILIVGMMPFAQALPPAASLVVQGLMNIRRRLWAIYDAGMPVSCFVCRHRTVHF